jgi:hypothetical protein
MISVTHPLEELLKRKLLLGFRYFYTTLDSCATRTRKGDKKRTKRGQREDKERSKRGHSEVKESSKREVGDHREPTRRQSNH